jgi:hypothetical protein
MIKILLLFGICFHEWEWQRAIRQLYIKSEIGMSEIDKVHNFRHLWHIYDCKKCRKMIITKNIKF